MIIVVKIKFDSERLRAENMTGVMTDIGDPH